MKRIFALIISIILVFAACPVTGAFADDDSVPGSWMASTYDGVVFYYDSETYFVDFDIIDYQCEIDKVEVYRADSADGDFEMVETVTMEETSYEDYNSEGELEPVIYMYGFYHEPIEPGETCYYKLRGYNGSEYTETPVITETATVNIPKVDIRCTGTQTLTLYFSVQQHAAGYYIYRYDPEKKKYVKIKDITDGDIHVYKNTGLKKNTGYKYKVAAYEYKSDGTKVFSKKSDIVKAGTCSNVYAAPVLIDKQYYKEHASSRLSTETSRISYSDGKVVAKLAVANSGSTMITKINWITLTVYHDGEIIATQKFKNKELNLNPKSYKTITFNFSSTGTKIKNANLRYGDCDVEWTANYEYLV